jgi:Kef-type K+ transport system membrane component KefB
MENYLNYHYYMDKVFLTMSVIIIITLLIYKIASRFGKPIVVGGIVAGMILSSSHIPVKYFDIDSCASLGSIGLVLFMMLLGSQLDFHQFTAKKSNVAITIISILVPFICGALFVPELIHLGFVNSYQQEHIFTFTAFIGLSISMAAFPIISMFIGHSGLINSPIGKFAIFCASIDEIVFWCLLTIIMIYFQKNNATHAYHPTYIILYLLFVFLVVPHLIKLIIEYIKSERAMIGFIISGCFLSATIADFANLHPVIGGFLFGIMLPKDNASIKHIRHGLNDFVNIALLPIYFVKTGIDANIHAAFNLKVVYIGLILTLIALGGKFIGSYIVGKILGYTRDESILLGSILNIRGVLEIALLNIGLEIGFISNQLYSMLIIMTLITTWIATTASLWIYNRDKVAPKNSSKKTC